MPVPSYRHLDTTTMPVVETAMNPGAGQQLLWKDDQTGATVALNYGPAGFTAKRVAHFANGPDRHYHDTVNERHYILGGDYPIWHYAHPDAPARLTVLRRHTFLENSPRTLHGGQPDSRPSIATAMLVWNNGGGTSIFDPAARHETREVPFDGSFRPNHGWAVPRIIVSGEAPWQPHLAMAQWKIRPLAPADVRQPPVAQVSLPPDAMAPGQVAAIKGAERRWLFMLSGDLSVAMIAAGATTAIALREGHFLSWDAGATLSYGAGTISQGGAVVLCIGHDLAAATE
ncbi:MAG: hypothetical protein EXQ85_09175 [Alphaproteobacteria bacterium]|nr:hypothetical protein [Alphaproteobacteria bacterium]